MLASTEAPNLLIDRQPNTRVAYVIDPRFPGGTSSAVAAEIEAILPLAQVELHGITTAMFSNRPIAPQIKDAVMRLGVPLHIDKAEISADIIIFHNPACLKFQDSLETKLIARHLIVVTHENFLRPGGALAFDVEKCLSVLVSHSLVLKRSLAPISPHNRATVQKWAQITDALKGWTVTGSDWFNICAAPTSPPTRVPKDRRGRLSRPGFEKFPTRETLELCFPKNAETNIILGADSLMQLEGNPPHWTLHPFGALSVDAFFDQIDFFVYYTASTWRESFGRVIAEALLAGKIVITDEETAKGFNGAAIGAPPQDVSEIIAGYLSDPERYHADVKRAQDILQQFSQEAFRNLFRAVLKNNAGDVL